jgi:alkylation response protein AidB-like acyl-CoA dehydrogenase
MLMATATPHQREKYLEPYAQGVAKSAIAISEPNAGGDPSGMLTRAEKDGDQWVINGRKIWVSRVPAADFTVVMARVGGGKRHEGITAFIVDKGTKGFEILREIPMLAGHRTYELAFEDCRIPAENILGEVGSGFAPMQLRLNIRRLQMGAWCLGMCRRAMEMMMTHAKQRTTFGALLSDRQAIQWWIADAAMKMHACRLMVWDAARKQDRGEDIRLEASMIKVYATEMASEVLDHAMQAFGAMGVTKELPLHLMAQRARVMRVYEGPSEVHRMSIAKRLLKEVK